MLASLPYARSQDIAETRLENGLRVIVKESFEKDVVAVSLHVDGGNRTEPRELSGLSHYYEHLIFRGGTRRQAELETRKVFLGLGELGGYTTADYTAYHFIVPSASFDEALWRFADATLHVEVTPAKVEKEREVILSEFKQSYTDSPASWAWYEMERAAFRKHPYGRTTIGLRDVLETADVERLRRFHAERYVPNHMVLAVVGAIHAEAAFEKVRAAFGHVKPGPSSFETGETEPPQTAARAVIVPRETAKSHVRLGWKAPGVLDPRADAIRVLAHVLGGGRASRLEREVRARRGLVIDIGAWWDETKDPGLLGVAFTAEPGREAEALEAVAVEAGRLTATEVPAAELEDARSALANERLLDEESALDLARSIARSAVLGEPHLGRDRAGRLRSVTGAEVRAAARALFTAATATVAVVRPREAPPLEEDALLAALRKIDEAAGPPPAARPAARPTVARTLRCGACAIAREDRAAPIVAASLEVPLALAEEPLDRPGLAALATRLLLRGAGPFDREALARRLEALGARLDAGLDRDALSIALEVPAARAAEALEVLAIVVLEPRFDEAELERARKEQIAVVETIGDRSFDLIAREFHAALYEPSSLYGRPLEGTVEGLRAATRNELLAWHARALRRERPVVAVAGAIEPEAALALLEGACARGPLAPKNPALGDFPITTGAPLPAAPPAIANPRAAPRRENLLRRPREQVAFRFGHVGIPAAHEDFVPLSIGVRHLATELFFRNVYEKGIAYRAWTYLRAGRAAHPFTFEMGVSKPNFASVRADLEAALRALRERGLTADEVARAKREAIQRHILGQLTAIAQASMLARYEAIGLGWAYADRFPALVQEATPERVNAAIRAHLDPERLVIVAVGDLDAGEER